MKSWKQLVVLFAVLVGSAAQCPSAIGQQLDMNYAYQNVQPNDDYVFQYAVTQGITWGDPDVGDTPGRIHIGAYASWHNEDWSFWITPGEYIGGGIYEEAGSLQVGSFKELACPSTGLPFSLQKIYARVTAHWFWDLWCTDGGGYWDHQTEDPDQSETRYFVFERLQARVRRLPIPPSYPVSQEPAVPSFLNTATDVTVSSGNSPLCPGLFVFADDMGSPFNPTTLLELEAPDRVVTSWCPEDPDYIGETEVDTTKWHISPKPEYGVKLVSPENWNQDQVGAKLNYVLGTGYKGYFTIAFDDNDDSTSDTEIRVPSSGYFTGTGSKTVKWTADETYGAPSEGLDVGWRVKVRLYDYDTSTVKCIYPLEINLGRQTRS